MPEKSSWFEKLYPYRWQILFLLLGVLFISGAVLIEKGDILQQPSIEIVEDNNNTSVDISSVVVEVSGSVVSPGVYKLDHGSRIDDALNAAGGITEEANKEWMDKYINKAAMITDGQKIYIPSQSDAASDNNSTGGVVGVSDTVQEASERVNINTASQSELESLWGIGPATAQNIIEQRMYSSVEELLTKGILKSNVYERNKDLLSVY